MTGFQVRRSTREPLNALSVSLAQEFSDHVPAGTVIRSVAQAREALLAVGVRAGLVVAVESMTRARLQALAATSGSASSAADHEQLSTRCQQSPSAASEGDTRDEPCAQHSARRTPRPTLRRAHDVRTRR
ncbi:hypothetical protein N866_15975 [Actinotalea ferrariae CF5-4]|uniref:Uncharacterized protein n=1 Tax=Actinotalea ferrariae CF5-4 TaxID=948458 RepID=A0A021VYE4_9CELL|nr:hypothetical protein N866_15975 [Actinotalea ferrariae CF5-4]